MEGNGPAIGRPEKAQKREGSVMSQVIRIMENRKVLSDQITRLEDRLKVVLKPQEPLAENGRKELEPKLAPLAEELSHMANRIAEEAKRVSFIIERIEL